MENITLPNAHEMCEDYKQYRKELNKVMENMTESERTKFLLDRHKKAKKLAKKWGKKPVKINHGGDKNGK